ncbi:MAG: hypothetical protein K8S87_06330 [Planctomycetes bacterium]|nr:hypothetical protein [Planctomycetota bacterium]
MSDRSLKTRIVSNKQIYFEGETANFMINSPTHETYALITFEGEEVLDYDVVKLTSNASEYKVVMKSLYSPNVFVKLTISTNHEWYQDETEVLVFRFLNVDIKSTKDIYAPGEDAEFEVKTTDQNGNPVKAELAVSLVDEAIYSLFPDMTPDMKPFFYDKKRTNAVNSFASYDWKYIGNTQKLPEEMMSEIERRKYEQDEKKNEGWADDDDGYLEEPSEAPARPMDENSKGRASSRYKRSADKRELAKDMEKAEAEMDSLSNSLKRKSGREAQSGKASKLQPSGRYPQKGLSIGQGGGSGGKQQFVQPVIRKIFRDTAAFIPFVTTDADGYAKLKLTLPDNLTTWRATARGITFETLVGEAKTKATVTKGVLARLDTPRFLNNGDLCAITGAVHNYLDEELSVQADFSAEGPVTIEGASSSSLKLKPGKSDIVDFALKANTAGESRLTFMARSTVESDAEQRDLTINPFGDYGQFAVSGNLVENIRDLKFNFPDEIVKGSVDAELMITPGYLNVLIDAMSGMLSKYGDNTARIVTQLYSACLTYKSMNTVGSVDVNRRKILDKFIKYALLELYDAQNYDGTFGWYIPKRNSYTSPSTWITAYSLMAMKLGIDNGFIVDGTVYSKAATAVYNFLRSGSSDNEKAILGYAYALYNGKNALPYLTSIYRRAKNLSNLGTAALALALSEAGNDRDAWELIQTLMKTAKREGSFVYWQGSEINVRNERYDKTGYRSYYSVYDSITASAWAFSAISAIQPENELMKPALKWLMRNRYGRYWGGSKTTTDVVHALSHYIDAKTSAMSTEMTVTVKLNGKEIKKLNINKDTIELGDRTIRIPADKFISGNNVLTIERDGTGDLNFAFLLKYYEPKDIVLAKGNLINVNRYYFKYEGENASRGYIKPGYSIVQPIYAPKYEPRQIDKIKSGDVVQVELKVRTRSTVKNLIVEDFLPAGCEVVTLGRNNAWQHMERRDNRVLFYLNDHSWGRETTIRYALRAINPGVFRAMPAFGSSYYQPEIYGHSNSNNLRIFDEDSWKESPELKKITPDEQYAEIGKLFKKKHWKEVVDAVEKLFSGWDKGKKLRSNIYEVCLFYQMKGFYNLEKFESMVDNYERIQDSNPKYYFNLDDRREVAISYYKIKDFMKCSILSAELIHDVLQIAYNVGNEYRSLREQLKAQQYLLDLWREYPDYAATSQMYYEVANYFASIPIEQDKESEYKFYKGDGVSTYVAMAYRQLQEFCAIYPTNELTDDAMYQSLRYAENLKSWETALRNGRVFISRYGFGENESRYLDDVLLAMTANYYKLENWDMVLETAMKLVTGKFKEYSKKIKEGYTVKLVPGESPYKSNAQLFIAKVYHALGNIKDALKYYQMVATKFSDAQAAIEYFTAAYLDTPDSVEASPKDDAKVKLTHKNLKKVHCAAYKIDLLILFSLHKSLGNIRNIELTGIDPTTEFDIELKKTEPYRENEEEVTLPIKDAGVYLLIFTAEHNIHKTTVVIKSDLEMRIQRTREYIRVYLTKRGSNVPVSDAYVKIAHNGRFVGSGKTDSRGVFEVSVRYANTGKLGVVAQKDEDFAFAQD